MKLEEHPFFTESDAEDVNRLIERTEVFHYNAGVRIFEEGTASDGLYLVLDGVVEFTKSMPDGPERSISFCKEGGFFGELGLFTGAARALSAVARTDLQIAMLKRDSLIDFIKNTPGPIEKILGSIVRHLHHTTKHYVDDMLQKEKMTVVGNMVNTIIHDFKNPFTLISLSAEMLRSMHPDERTKKLCNNIDAQVKRMVAMANEISEFSRGGQQQLDLHDVELCELLKTFKELNDPYFARDNVKFEIETEPVVVRAEDAKLLRVLQNLVGNALEALADRVDGRISISISDFGDFGRIAVSDNAGGIPDSIQENLFDPFVTFGKTHGTGLGTAIVKSIVEAHQGSITFDSVKGKGTTFTVLLPKDPSEKRITKAPREIPETSD